MYQLYIAVDLLTFTKDNRALQKASSQAKNVSFLVTSNKTVTNLKCYQNRLFDIIDIGSRRHTQLELDSSS